MKNIFYIALFFFIVTHSFSDVHSNNLLPVDSRIKTLIYSPNEIFQVKFMLGYQSILELAQNEEVELISFGDSIPWSLRTVGRRIFIKALDPGVKTNMTIITNKRTYLLEISSTESMDEVDDRIAYILRFFYPEINIDTTPPVKKDLKINSKAVEVAKLADSQVDNVSKRFVLSDREKATQIAGLSPLNLQYTYAGSDTELMPVKVFDNGLQTYFQFAHANALIPAVSAVDENGKETLLKTRLVGDFVVVNSVGKQFSLRRNKKLLCIFNEKSTERKVVAQDN